MRFQSCPLRRGKGVTVCREFKVGWTADPRTYNDSYRGSASATFDIGHANASEL